MIGLRDAIEQYLVLRRDLGFKLKGAHYLLREFADFMEEQDAISSPPTSHCNGLCCLKVFSPHTGLSD
jgi:hypothetical protein